MAGGSQGADHPIHLIWLDDQSPLLATVGREASIQLAAPDAQWVAASGIDILMSFYLLDFGTISFTMIRTFTLFIKCINLLVVKCSKWLCFQLLNIFIIVIELTP